MTETVEVNINWNYGIGIEAVSTFVKIVEPIQSLDKLESVYETIRKVGIKDVIVYGEINSCVETLNWLFCRLLSCSYFTTVLCKSYDTEIIEKVFSSRLVVSLYLDDIIKSNLQSLTESDYILIRENKVQRIIATLSRLSGLGIRVGRLYFSTFLIDRNTALQNKLFVGIYPYDGFVW